MRSSYRLFKIFGISVELHYTFLLFLVLVLLFDPAFFAVWVSVFVIVLIHELFHSMAAKGFGIKVPKITLTPIGGLANIDLPENPKKEFLISIAGPFSNFLLMFIIMLSAFYVNIPLEEFLNYSGIGGIDITDPASILVGFFWINLILGVFNMLPGFPMDGGRVFRAFLAFFMDYIKATEIAVYMGRIISVLFFIIGLYGNPFLMIIAVFLFFSGGQELEILKIRHAFHGLKAKALAVQQMRYVNEHVSLKDFMETVAVPEQEHYPVTDYTGKIIGILHMDSLTGYKGDPEKATARDFTDKRIEAISSQREAEDAVMEILSKEFVLVVEGDRVLGYVTPKHLLSYARFYKIREG